MSPVSKSIDIDQKPDPLHEMQTQTTVLPEIDIMSRAMFERIRNFKVFDHFPSIKRIKLRIKVPFAYVKKYHRSLDVQTQV